ncbi:MAG: hypothetical protein QXU92_04455 [Candidatus Diapherotrites archaeon]
MKNFLLSFLLLSVFLAGCPLTDDSVNVQILTVDESENFLDAVTVYVYDSYSNLVNQVRSNNGVASVSLKKGTYEFKAYQEGYDSSSVVQTISQENPIVKIVLKATETKFEASVKVKTPDDYPISNAKVVVQNDSLNYSESGITNEKGLVQFVLPSSGMYNITATSNDTSQSLKGVFFDKAINTAEIRIFFPECSGELGYSCIEFLGGSEFGLYGAKFKLYDGSTFVASPGSIVTNTFFSLDKLTYYYVIYNESVWVHPAGLGGYLFTLFNSDDKNLSYALLYDKDRGSIAKYFSPDLNLVKVGDKFNVKGAGPYAGKKLILIFSNTNTDDIGGGSFPIKVNLLDPQGSIEPIASAEVARETDLRKVLVDKSGESLIESEVYVKEVFRASRGVNLRAIISVKNLAN